MSLLDSIRESLVNLNQKLLSTLNNYVIISLYKYLVIILVFLTDYHFFKRLLDHRQINKLSLSPNYFTPKLYINNKLIRYETIKYGTS